STLILFSMCDLILLIAFLFFLLFYFFFFFFFQAEDGIRDLYVTGVQTCALPILPRPGSRAPARPPRGSAGRRRDSSPAGPATRRSEERRVGKECRSRWSPDH